MGTEIDVASESLWSQGPPSFLAPILASSRQPFSTTSSLARNIGKVKKHVYRDAYVVKQIKQRKDAHLSRQTVLREQRAKELGDPIRGISTPFVESFDTEIPQEIQQDADSVSLEVLQANPDKPPPSPTYASNENHLDHGIEHAELAKSLEFSRSLTEPVLSSNAISTNPDQEDKLRQKWESRDASAVEAIQRIVSLANASSKHRTKKNIERIIETFGRHHTDQVLKPKATASVKHNLFVHNSEPTPRAGPDTGSSEVQIGILTAKIRVLADRYEGENRNDKINKRNLRLLLHRRQKLLSYMERKERGSERWQKMITTLGLTPACWKGQIAVE